MTSTHLNYITTIASVDTTTMLCAYDEVVLRPQGKTVVRNEALCMIDTRINELIAEGVTSGSVTFNIRNGYMFTYSDVEPAKARVKYVSNKKKRSKKYKANK
jgi:hypothetical protein